MNLPSIPPEITGAIIGIIGTLIISILGFSINALRGNKVKLKKITESSLLSISNLISDNLSIKFKEKPVEKIKLYELELTNDGYIDIENFEVTLAVEPKEKSNFIEVILLDYLEKATIFINGEYNYLIARPFFNIKKKNKEEKLLIQIFSDSELKINIKGGGKGWSVTYKDNLITNDL